MTDNVKFLSDSDFRNLAKENKSTGNGVHKGFPCTVKVVDEEKRLIDFTISTETVDRTKDVIKVAGWELDNYQKNPVILFGHDHKSPPIGKAISVRKRPNLKKLESRAEFLPKEISPFADMIFQMYLKGFMNATSVGMIPMEWEWSDDEDRKKSYGIDFIKQELIEYSAVPVPANPDALMGMRSKGIDTAPLMKWAGDTMDDYDVHKESGLIVQRKTLEQMYKHANPKDSKSFAVTNEKKKSLAQENLERLKQQEKEVEEKTMEHKFLDYLNAEVTSKSLTEDSIALVKEAEKAYQEKSVSQLKITLEQTTWDDPKDDDKKALDEDTIKEVLAGVFKEDSDWLSKVEELYEAKEIDTDVTPETVDEVTDGEVEEKSESVDEVNEKDAEDTQTVDEVTDEDADALAEKSVDNQEDTIEIDGEEKNILEAVAIAIKSLEDTYDFLESLDIKGLSSSKRGVRNLSVLANVSKDLLELANPMQENEEISDEGVDKTTEISETYEIELEEDSSSEEEEKDLSDLDAELLNEVFASDEFKELLAEETAKAIDIMKGKIVD